MDVARPDKKGHRIISKDFLLFWFQSHGNYITERSIKIFLLKLKSLLYHILKLYYAEITWEMVINIKKGNHFCQQVQSFYFLPKDLKTKLDSEVFAGFKICFQKEIEFQNGCR